jgi:hypothetical protein
MLSTSKISLLALALTLAAPVTQAYDKYWNDIGFSGKVRDYKFYLKSDQRFRDKASDFHYFNGKLGISRMLTDQFEGGIEFRYGDDENSSGIHTDEIRIAPFLVHKYQPAEHWQVASRLRLENRWKDSDYNFRTRLRVKVSRAFSGFGLYASHEYFYDVSNSSFNQTRTAAGGTVKVTDKLSAGVYLMHQDSGATSAQVLGTSISYKL